MTNRFLAAQGIFKPASSFLLINPFCELWTRLGKDAPHHRRVFDRDLNLLFAWGYPGDSSKPVSSRMTIGYRLDGFGAGRFPVASHKPASAFIALSDNDRAELSARLHRSKVERCPLPKLRQWMQPRLIARVRHLAGSQYLLTLLT